MGKDMNLDFISACIRNAPQAMLHKYGSDSLPSQPVLVQAQQISCDGNILFLLPETHSQCLEVASRIPVRLHFVDSNHQFHVNIVGMMQTDTEKSREHYYRNASGAVPVWVTVKIHTAEYAEHESEYSWTTELKNAWHRIFSRRIKRYELAHH